MSDYIMGLGVSVKICNIYSELVYLALMEKENTDIFSKLVLELKKLLYDEAVTYNKLDNLRLKKYFNNILLDDTNNIDNVRNRYYNQLKERVSIIDSKLVFFNNDGYFNFSFSVDTVIVGKILIESLKKLDYIINSDMDINVDILDIRDLHKIYKYTLISNNLFLESLAVLVDYDINRISSIDFNAIKNKCNYKDNFYKYLNNLLSNMAKDLINGLVNDDMTDDMYFSLFSMVQFETIISYMNKESCLNLFDYLKSIDCSNNYNVKYISLLIKKKVL